MDTITITFDDNTKKEYIKGVKLKEIIEDVKDNYNYDIIIGKFKNQLISYSDSLIKSGTLSLYDINTKIGNRVYEKGLINLFISSAIDVLGKDTVVSIKHSLDKGIFCEIDKPLNKDIIAKIKEVMTDKVNRAIPFVKIETSRLEAIEYFKRIKRLDKAKTLFYNTSPFITLYKFDGMYNYVIGELPYDTSVLKYFDLTLLENGVVLRFPFVYDEIEITKYIHHEKYFKSVLEYSKWAKVLHINNVGELNEYITNNKVGELIHLSEIMQDYKLLSIAEKIALNKNNIKFVLISGPSSSGKTTTSKKLSLYLKTLGLNPIQLSLDDYFLNRDETPIQENGKPDYESIKAIDIKLFNNQLTKLLKGEKVDTPIFDFSLGKKVFTKTIKMNNNDILIIEGLHALNEELTNGIPKKNKFKIYISPLTFLNIDNDNRINMTDIRLLRRIIRDNRLRGYNPSHTLNNWSEVRKGEVKYVFPYQDDADVIFNTSYAYELGVLKTYVEPLLYSVLEDDPEYLTATRLLEILKFVLPIPSEEIPKTSIIREFIGGSYFKK